jgi:hypothetical protein
MSYKAQSKIERKQMKIDKDDIVVYTILIVFIAIWLIVGYYLEMPERVTKLFING